MKQTQESNEFTVEEQEQRMRRAKKMLMYVGVFSITMLFAGFTSAYIVSMSDGFWVNLNLPSAFWWSTVYLLLSSLTIYLALRTAKGNNFLGVKVMVATTFILGLLFTKSQFDGWKQLMELGNYATGSIDAVKGVYGEDYTFLYAGEELVFEDGEFYLASDKERDLPLKSKIEQSKNTASSYMYIITAMHLAHLLGGLIYLVVLLVSAFKHKFNSGNYLKLELGGIYWHFLDLLWIYLLLFLHFIH